MSSALNIGSGVRIRRSSTTLTPPLVVVNFSNGHPAVENNPSGSAQSAPQKHWPTTARESQFLFPFESLRDQHDDFALAPGVTLICSYFETW